MNTNVGYFLKHQNLISFFFKILTLHIKFSHILHTCYTKLKKFENPISYMGKIHYQMLLFFIWGLISLTITSISLSDSKIQQSFCQKKLV